MVTSDLNPSFMCTSKSDKNPERSILGVLQPVSSILEMPQSDWLVPGLSEYDCSI